MSDENVFRITDNTPRELRFHTNMNQTVAVIGTDGIMRFTVDANDENARQFVECIERFISRRLTGVEVEKT